jgi:hypothetical protein
MGVELTPEKRLQYFRAVPQREVKIGRSSSAPTWSDWFTPETTGFFLPRDADEAQSAKNRGIEQPVLDVVNDRFRTPPDAFDTVGVWRYVDSDSGEELYVEAAAFDGLPTYYEVFTSEEFETVWNFNNEQGGTELRLGREMVMWIYFIMLIIWPRILISWTRLLDGRWRDPLVGRDLLVGTLAGATSSFLLKLNIYAQLQFSESAPPLMPTDPLALAGTKELLGTALNGFTFAIFTAMYFLLLLLLLRVLLRTERRAVFGCAVVLVTIITLLREGTPAITAIPVTLHVVLILTMLVRFGFLAYIAQGLTIAVVGSFPLTMNADAWYFDHGLFAVAWIAAIALYGFYTSQGGRWALNAGRPTVT